MREGGRRQPGKPPLPEQMLSAISPVAFTKEEKCGLLQGLKLLVLPSPAPRVCVCVPWSREGLARAAWAGGQGNKEINKCPLPTLPACVCQSCRVLGFSGFVWVFQHFS